MLAAAFIDEAVEAQGQGGTGWSTADEETESGLLVPGGQRDIADLAGVLPGGDQGD
ncbi:hypothetical protein D3C80_2221150 [compost metagenome]